MQKTLFVTVAVLSPFVALYAFIASGMMYTLVEYNPLFAKFMQTPAVALTHFIGGGIALIIGLFQFHSGFRATFPKVHTVLGMIYFFNILISGGAGLELAVAAEGGLMAQSGFFLLDLLWIITAVISVWFISKGNIDKHRFWIYLNFSLTLAAVTLRIELPLGSALFGFEVVYPFIAWLCWVPNLFVAYWLVRK